MAKKLHGLSSWAHHLAKQAMFNIHFRDHTELTMGHNSLQLYAYSSGSFSSSCNSLCLYPFSQIPRDHRRAHMDPISFPIFVSASIHLGSRRPRSSVVEECAIVWRQPAPTPDRGYRPVWAPQRAPWALPMGLHPKISLQMSENRFYLDSHP